MKKFAIISAVLLVLAVGAFGFSLYHYMQVTNLIGGTAPAAEEVATEAEAPEATAAEQPDAPETAPAAVDIFAANAAKASTYMEDMTTEQMVGQLIMGICADSSAISSEIDRYSLSGMLFESDNFIGMTKDDITTLLHTATSESKIKPILAAQEEGGSYTTVSDLSDFTEYDFNAPRTEFDVGGLQAVEKAEDDKTLMLKSVGFNFNLAPVIDLSDSSDQIMYSRSISGDVDTVSAFAEYAAKFDQAKGVSVALKHFPGYGTVPDSAYTGLGAIVDDRDAETIRSTDYVPFQKGAAAGAHCIVVSNVVVQNIDSAHTAALSPTIHSELRSTVGFTGIVMTDVLDAEDYSEYADGNKPVVQAILAGNDIVLVRDYATAYSDLLAAVNAGTISDAQLKEACARVLAYKYTAGIMS